MICGDDGASDDEVDNMQPSDDVTAVAASASRGNGETEMDSWNSLTDGADADAYVPARLDAVRGSAPAATIAPRDVRGRYCALTTTARLSCDSGRLQRQRR